MSPFFGSENVAAWLGEEPIASPATLLTPFPPERLAM